MGHVSCGEFLVVLHLYLVLVPRNVKLIEVGRARLEGELIARLLMVHHGTTARRVLALHTTDLVALP